MIDAVGSTNGTHDLIDTKLNGVTNKKNNTKNTKLNGKNHETAASSQPTALNENEIKYKFVVEKIKSKLNNTNATKSHENKMKGLDLNGKNNNNKIESSLANNSVGDSNSIELNNSISKKLNKTSNSKGNLYVLRQLSMIIIFTLFKKELQKFMIQINIVELFQNK